MSKSTRLLVVKLGGSVVSHKECFEALNTECLAALASRLACVHSRLMNTSSPACYMVVVHGAGSFGHHQAKQGRVHLGRSSSCEFPAVPFAATRSSVTRLNTAVVCALLDADLPAVSMSPFPVWHRSPSLFADCVLDAMREGLIPVLHGDAVLDPERRCAILSGDTLVSWLAAQLANRLDVDRVVATFLTDVPGVLSSPPPAETVYSCRSSSSSYSSSPSSSSPSFSSSSSSSSPSSSSSVLNTLVRRIRPGTGGEESCSVAQVGGSAHGHDTTGGMAKKLEAACAVAMLPTGVAHIGHVDSWNAGWVLRLLCCDELTEERSLPTAGTLVLS